MSTVKFEKKKQDFSISLLKYIEEANGIQQPMIKGKVVDITPFLKTYIFPDPKIDTSHDYILNKELRIFLHDMVLREEIKLTQNTYQQLGKSYHDKDGVQKKYTINDFKIMAVK